MATAALCMDVLEERRADWPAFFAGDAIAREAIILENLSLVHHVARQLERTLSNELDHDELVSAGTLGLMSAMNVFDPERGLSFSTFAVPRIRGAILDELRRQDYVPRSVRRKLRQIHTARSALASTLQRVPADADVADVLGVDVETLWRWKQDVEGSIHIAVDRPLTSGGEYDSGPVLVDGQLTPDVLAEVADRDSALYRAAAATLTEREIQVIVDCYWRGLTQREIARRAGVTESRISQVMCGAYAKLREALAEESL